MDNRFARSQRLLGPSAIETLRRSTVVVFGLGGVGSYICEALARGGVGHLIVVDGDCVDRTNINRQLIALDSTVGKPKAEVMHSRLLDINPQLTVDAYHLFYTADNAHTLSFEGVDYIADAIDTVTSKLLLVERAAASNIPIISSMGTGNKMDPLRLTVSDISKTSGCPLARVMRRELRNRGINHLKVVYSEEPAMTPLPDDEPLAEGKRQSPGSLPFVPSVAGLIIASEIIADLTGVKLR